MIVNVEQIVGKIYAIPGHLIFQHASPARVALISRLLLYASALLKEKP